MHSKRILVSGAIATAVLIGGLTAFHWPADTLSRADPFDSTQTALGKARYDAYCASCHGASLQGQPNWRDRSPDGKLPAPPHDESGHTWHHSDRQLFEITKQGTAAFAPQGYKTDMTGFADVLSDAEIWAVLAYIKSTWRAAIRERQDALNRQRR